MSRIIEETLQSKALILDITVDIVDGKQVKKSKRLNAFDSATNEQLYITGEALAGLIEAMYTDFKVNEMTLLQEG